MSEVATVIISVEKTGHVNQCVAFCEQIKWPISETILVPGPSRMNAGWRNSLIRFRRWLALRQLLPHARGAHRLRIVASGTSAEPLVAAYRTLYGADLYAASVGSPRWPNKIFDIAVASHHALTPGSLPSPTYYKGARLVAWMPGVLVRPMSLGNHGITRPVVVALIGGINKAFELDEAKIVEQLKGILRDNAAADFVVVFSRRTPRRLERQIRGALAQRAVSFVDRGDRNGFLSAIGRASQFVVTPDSITMICEAYSTRKPVVILDLPCFNRNTSTALFVAEVRGFPKGSEHRLLSTAANSVVRAAELDFREWLTGG